MRFQFGTSNRIGRGGRRYPPYVFTEQGIAMLSSVLNSPRAIQVNIVIMKTFIRLREIIRENQNILKRLDDVEKKLMGQDLKIEQVFRVIRDVLEPTVKSKKRIGIRVTQHEND